VHIERRGEDMVAEHSYHGFAQEAVTLKAVNRFKQKFGRSFDIKTVCQEHVKHHLFTRTRNNIEIMVEKAALSMQAKGNLYLGRSSTQLQSRMIGGWTMYFGDIPEAANFVQPSKHVNCEDLTTFESFMMWDNFYAMLEFTERNWDAWCAACELCSNGLTSVKDDTQLPSLFVRTATLCRIQDSDYKTLARVVGHCFRIDDSSVTRGLVKALLTMRTERTYPSQEEQNLSHFSPLLSGELLTPGRGSSRADLEERFRFAATMLTFENSTLTAESNAPKKGETATIHASVAVPWSGTIKVNSVPTFVDKNENSIQMSWTRNDKVLCMPNNFKRLFATFHFSEENENAFMTSTRKLIPNVHYVYQQKGILFYTLGREPDDEKIDEAVKVIEKAGGVFMAEMSVSLSLQDSYRDSSTNAQCPPKQTGRILHSNPIYTSSSAGDAHTVMTYTQLLLPGIVIVLKLACGGFATAIVTDATSRIKSQHHATPVQLVQLSQHLLVSFRGTNRTLFHDSTSPVVIVTVTGKRNAHVVDEILLVTQGETRYHTKLLSKEQQEKNLSKEQLEKNKKKNREKRKTCVVEMSVEKARAAPDLQVASSLMSNIPIMGVDFYSNRSVKNSHHIRE
jgi:hypothetical protein